MYFLYN